VRTNTITIIGTTTNNTCGNTFTATRTWRATDACGNQAQCSQTVTVVDTLPPFALFPSAKTNQCNQAVVFGYPTNITDGCGTNYSVVVTTPDQTTSDGLNRIVHTRCWRVYDACSNSVEGVRV